MKREVGLWIDHRQAVIVINLDQAEEIKRVTSSIGKHIHYSGASEANERNGLHNDTTEDRRDRRFSDRLNRYYDEVIMYLGDANSILILGPGEAKVEFQKRVGVHGLSDRIVGIKAAAAMNDGRIVAEVRQHFSEHGSNRIRQQ